MRPVSNTPHKMAGSASKENVFATPDGDQNTPGGSPAPQGCMSVVRLIVSLRFARSRKAPRSHCGSATCAPGLAAPDRSGVPPLCAFGLLCCCCRFRSSCVGTTLQPANETAQARFTTIGVYTSVISNAKFRKRGQRPRCHRSRCRTAHSGPRSAGPHSHDAPTLTYGSRKRTSQFTHGLSELSHPHARARSHAHSGTRRPELEGWAE